MRAGKRWDDRIGRRLKPRDLHILMTVVQCGSMGKAAAQLAVSQSAISKAVSDIEHTVGVRLLDRTAQGVEPTVYGNTLVKWGTTVFDDLNQAVREIEFLADPTAGEVRIGGIEVTMAGLMPAIIDRLSRQYPRIVFKVVQESRNIALQYQDLRDRNIDIIIGRLPGPITDSDVDVELLFEDPFCIAAGLNSKWQRHRGIDIAELMDEPWALPSRDTFVGGLFVNWFQSKGLDYPRYTVETTSLQLIEALLATGRFLALFSGSALQLSGIRLGLKALPVTSPLPSGPVGIVTLKNRTLSPAVQLFVDCAREVVMRLAEKSKGAAKRQH